MGWLVGVCGLKLQKMGKSDSKHFWIDLAPPRVFNTCIKQNSLAVNPVTKAGYSISKNSSLPIFNNIKMSASPIVKLIVKEPKKDIKLKITKLKKPEPLVLPLDQVEPACRKLINIMLDHTDKKYLTIIQWPNIGWAVFDSAIPAGLSWLFQGYQKPHFLQWDSKEEIHWYGGIEKRCFVDFLQLQNLQSARLYYLSRRSRFGGIWL